MDDLVAQMNRDLFAKQLGIELISVEPGKAQVQMTTRAEHCNALNMVHGGVIFTVADYAFAVACNSYGTAAVAVNAHISYLRAATQGRLVAEATEIAKSRRLGTYSIRVLDGEGELVAVFQGMAYRKDTPIAEAQERSAG